MLLTNQVMRRFPQPIYRCFRDQQRLSKSVGVGRNFTLGKYNTNSM